MDWIKLLRENDVYVKSKRGYHRISAVRDCLVVEKIPPLKEHDDDEEAVEVSEPALEVAEATMDVVHTAPAMKAQKPPG